MQGYPDRGLHGRTVGAIGRRIVGGMLAPGATIEVDRLTEEFDVSRTVVREALRVLAGKGLIGARPKRGTFVTERDSWNLLDPDVLRWQFDSKPGGDILERFAEVRSIIEPAAATLAALRRVEQDLSEMEAALDDMEAAEESTDLIVTADQRFHRALFAATRNELLGQLGMMVEIGLHARDAYVHGHRVSIKLGLGRHREVAQAIRDRDGERAGAAMRSLLEEAAHDVRRLQRGGPR